MSADQPQAAHGPLTCPRCQGENAADAVFCANQACNKALGEFPYVGEEIEEASTFIQKLADRVSAWAGHPHFVTLHVLWIGAWVLLNSPVGGGALIFDAYPFGLLGIILAIEATLVSTMLLISNQRKSQFDGKRAELEYRANISSHRLLQALAQDVARLQKLAAEKGSGEVASAKDCPHS